MNKSIATSEPCLSMFMYDYDPNDCPAIAVASNLGKFLASILLQNFNDSLSLARKKIQTPLSTWVSAQNAQTADHILALSTCIEKFAKVQPYILVH